MEGNKLKHDDKVSKQAAMEAKALGLLDKFEEIRLTDDFNRKVINSIRKEHKTFAYNWLKPLAAVAVSVAAVVVLLTVYEPPQQDSKTSVVSRTDVAVVEHLELLDKMEILEHLDELADTESTMIFLQLLERG